MRLFKLFLLFLVAAIPAMAQVNDTYVIAAAANQRGGFGSHWMTRFSVFNPHTDYPLTVSITFLPTGGAKGIEELVDIPANSLAYSDNLLDDLYGVQGGGALLVATFPEDNPKVPNNVLARSFLVISDTYNNLSSGTYGQTIPGVWAGLLDYDFDGISAVAHGVRNISSQGWRTNVGAANLGRCSVTVRLNVYDADGRKILNQAPLVVPPLGHIQDSLPVTVDSGSVEFFVDDPCSNDDSRYAVVFPYVSTIDQLSGDPTYQVPTLLASPSVLFSKGPQAQSVIDPTSVGKKIDSAYARTVRAQMEHRGKARLQRTIQGWQIVK
ncbi:MAG TPA: hypothetical protein VJZ00_04555 [Thermoanaerobaculia bacterium]|nr:hypothetical protein [Thermoanaerobaculia bacterium]